VIALVNPTVLNLINHPVVVKGDNGGSSQNEWNLYFDNTGILIWNLSDLAQSKRICRNGAALSDTGVFHCYIATSAGGSPTAVTGLKIYRDGSQYDTTSYTSGVYAGMSNSTSTVGTYFGGSTVAASMKYGVVLVVSKELTAAEVKRISDRLLSYSGNFI
jgi:hypothetical protein